MRQNAEGAKSSDARDRSRIEARIVASPVKPTMKPRVLLMVRELHDDAGGGG